MANNPFMEELARRQQDRPRAVNPFAAELQQREQGIAFSDVPAMALRNLPESAERFGEDLIQPFLHPVETAKNVGNLAVGAVQKLIPGEQESEVYADAVGQFFADRYGGWENVKRTMAEDPVGFLADVSTVLTGGGAALARAPGMMGQVGRAVSTAGRITDPVRATAAAVRPIVKPMARGAGRGAAALVGELGTHTGRQSIETAARAGYRGGQASEAFRESMRGLSPVEDAVQDARQALQSIRLKRGVDYRRGMAQVAGDATVLDFAPIDRAMGRAARIKSFKGVPISKSTAKVTGDIQELLDQWKALDPTEYHTPEGLDALKQAIGDIRDATDFGSPSRAVADQAYNAVKGEIVKQAPTYAKTMRSYWQASEVIKEMERTLSLNPKATVDTQLRKLQSLLRNNANTNYGRRLVLGEMLVEAGADNLMEKLSGQALQGLAPRGLGRVVAGGIAAGGYIDPQLLMLLPAQSPRLMGEAAYAGGQAAKRLSQVPGSAGLAAFQAGRLE